VREDWSGLAAAVAVTVADAQRDGVNLAELSARRRVPSFRTVSFRAAPPDRTWGGPGVGAVCVICDLPVRPTEMEFEIQFQRNGENPGLDKYHVHIRCFAAWEFERQSF
jgi:hypothetical protein